MKRLLLVLFFLLCSGCVSTQVAIKENCKATNHINWIQGNDACLRIITKNSQENPEALIIFLHGDGPDFGPSDYFGNVATRLTLWSKKTTVVSIIRPGYFDSDKNYSSGSTLGRYDNYTPSHVDVIADAVLRLKNHYKPQKIILTGHSGGAAIAGVIIGRHPELVDAAVLAACPCDIWRWRSGLGKTPWRKSLCPSEYIQSIDRKTKIIALAGSKDTNTFPSLTKNYIEKLKARGLQAEYKILQGVSHDEVVQSLDFIISIRELLP